MPMSLEGEDRRRLVAAGALVVGALGVLALTVLTNSKPQYVAPVAGALMLIGISWRRMLAWRSLLTITVLLILFIPIKRYAIPSALPFQLEPYRIFIAFAALGWIASLLVDPRVRARKTGIEAPLLLVAVAVAASVIANPARASSVSSEVTKSVVFFASFFVIVYLTVSCLRRLRDIDLVVRWLVASGAVLAIFAVVERRTNYNFFNHLSTFLPLKLNRAALPPVDLRGGRLRVAASAQHPIALGAAFALLLPLAVYAIQTQKRKFPWILAMIALTLGVFSTGSRTAIVMLMVIILVFFWLRPRQMKRFWPALVPMLLVIHVAAPGTLGTVKESFFPQGGLIAEQNNAGIGNARLSTLGPTLRNEWEPNAIFGVGFATRVTTTDADVAPNAPILDDQWLGVLTETGIIGAFAFAWLFIRFVRRAGKEAKKDLSERGSLLVATVASVAAFAVSMFTYDAFSFIQVTFLLFIVLGLGCATWQTSPETASERVLVPNIARGRWMRSSSGAGWQEEPVL